MTVASMYNCLAGTETTPALLLGTGTSAGGVPLDGANTLVATTATQVVVTAAAHAGRNVVLNSTHTVTVTLPAASGTGNLYTFLVGVTGTDGSKIIQVANSTDVINGASIVANTQATVTGFLSTASDDTITLNFTTTGGVVGTKVEILDVAAGKFLAQIFGITTGNPATPFSNAV